ncbi:MAG: hypothetical protein IJL76_02880 [Bacilli bacterium]|nr:hypothetical protein [Bacilli bacterium]
MNKKSKQVYIILLLLVILIIFGIYVVLCRYSEKVLRKEVNEVVNMKIDSDYKTSCKSFFGYCDIEEAIKNYMSDYSIKLNKIKEVPNDKKLSNVLTISNYKEDGPKFEKSIKYLNDTVTSYDKDVDSLIKMSDKKYLNNYIKNYTNSHKYIDLYKKIIDEEDVYEKVDNINELKVNKKNIDTTITVSIATLEFLRDNHKQWKIDGNKIKFNNYKYLNKYNAYLKKLK